MDNKEGRTVAESIRYLTTISDVLNSLTSVKTLNNNTDLINCLGHLSISIDNLKRVKKSLAKLTNIQEEEV